MLLINISAEKEPKQFAAFITGNSLFCFVNISKVPKVKVVLTRIKFTEDNGVQETASPWDERGESVSCRVI